jgi:hypothetical protein
MAKHIAPVLNLLESLRAKSQVQSFLKSCGQAYSGTWAQVRQRIERAISPESIQFRDLVSLLEEIEEHGTQYAYFFDLNRAKASKLESAQSLERCLTPQERETILNNIRVIESPPDEATLVSARHDSGWVKLKWVQKRSFRRPMGETVRGRIVTVKYEIVETRAVDLALFDLSRNRAYLFVQKAEPSIRDYRKQLRALENRLARFLEDGALSPLDLGRLLKRLNEEGFSEARRRRCQARDESGSIMDVTSATEDGDIFDGELYKAARDHYSGEVASLHANVYWKPVAGKLERELHTIFPYRHSPNAVILTQRCLRSERDYVLSRIESLARGES